jgi:hypothetical protein
MTNEPCYLCGKPNTVIHHNGIDRVDNNNGYILDNCKSCCGDCNYMKKTFTIESFFVKMQAIYHTHYNTIS